VRQVGHLPELRAKKLHNLTLEFNNTESPQYTAKIRKPKFVKSRADLPDAVMCVEM